MLLWHSFLIKFTLCQKKVSRLMCNNNCGRCGPIFKILSPVDSWENSLCTHTKSHLRYVATLPCEIQKVRNVTYFGGSRKWRLTDTDLCPCGESQTTSHIVESCLLTKLNGVLSRLHSADEDAVSWLTGYGSWNAYEKKTASSTNCSHVPENTLNTWFNI